jgi:inhibitor of cysteine peptidase
MLLITENDNGRTITIQPGNCIQITLFENASTGYRWSIENYTSGLVDHVSAEPHPTGAAMGSGGTIAFVFRAKSVGSAAIALKHWRPWEGDASILERFKLHLNIQS